MRERNRPMTNFVLPAPATPAVAVEGEAARFPVRRIFCVGRNYAAHAREMGRDPERELPFFFTKPADAVVDTGTTVPYATRRFEEHVHRFNQLYDDLNLGKVDPTYVELLETHDNIFPNVDYRIYAS